MPTDPSSRIASMDQFRGYTIAGMVLVNFIGYVDATHPVFKHNVDYFSYADSVMPAFHFCVGFAFRLTLLRRLLTQNAATTYVHFIRRNLGLILLALVISPIGAEGLDWATFTEEGLWGFLARPLKRGFWNTLAIIGATSLFVLPVVAARARVRITFLLAAVVAYTVVSHYGYFAFNWAALNWLDAYWGVPDEIGLDGGLLGCMAWAMPQILGSLAYDLIVHFSKWKAGCLILLLGTLFMIIGFALSCLSTLYDQKVPIQHETKYGVAESPVIPPENQFPDREWHEYLAEPPFVSPPAKEERPLNYWMMSKRAVTLSFNVFSTGMSLATFALFIFLSALGRIEFSVFRTFGMNPLAAYLIHDVTSDAVDRFTPDDSPLYWVLITFALYVAITWLFVRYLEKRNIYLRM